MKLAKPCNCRAEYAGENFPQGEHYHFTRINEERVSIAHELKAIRKQISENKRQLAIWKIGELIHMLEGKGENE